MKQKPRNKVNYTYCNDDDDDERVHMVELVDVEYYEIITIKGKKDKPKPKTPFILKGPTSKNLTMSHHKLVSMLLHILMPSYYSMDLCLLLLS